MPRSGILYARVEKVSADLAEPTNGGRGGDTTHTRRLVLTPPRTNELELRVISEIVVAVSADDEQASPEGEDGTYMGRVAASGGGGGGGEMMRYRGVRRRRWGKWVSEIRVPGTRERLWLGSYATAEAAAVAHDVAVCLLRLGGGRRAAAGGGGGLNFPARALAADAAASSYGGAGGLLSPRSVQRVASDAGMAADAQLVDLRRDHPPAAAAASSSGSGVAGDGARKQGTRGEVSDTYWCRNGEDWSRSWSSGSEELIVYEGLSVDDMEILM